MLSIDSIYSGVSMNTQLTRQDIQILSLLQDDASISVEAIAEKLAMSKSACWRRIKKYEELGIIRGRFAVLEPNKVNLSLTVYISVRTQEHSDEWSSKFLALMETLPEIIEVHRMSGDLDYLIKAVLSDMSRYDDLYVKLCKTHPMDISAAFVMKTLRSTTRLPLQPTA